MTVNTTIDRQSFTCDGVMTVFTFTFKILETTHMTVYFGDTPQLSGFTTAIDASGVGGTVTFATVPPAATALLLKRAVPYTQGTALAVEDSLPELTLENMSDKLTMLSQQLDERINRALTLLISSSKSGAFYNEPTATLTLPQWNTTDSRFEFVSVATAFNNAVPASGGGNITGPGPSVTDFSIPMYNGTGGLSLRAGSAIGVSGTIFMSNGVGIAPTWQALPVDVFVGHRLSLTTAVPVTTADVTAAGTLYFVPYKSRTTWLRYAAGSNVWKAFNFAEISLALVLTSGKPYDVFCYATSETAAALEVLVWTNDTTRATALVRDTTSGYLVKTGDTSKVYVGTLYSTGANTTEDSAARRLLWNNFNRVARSLFATDTTNTWAYATATFRSANASAVDGVGRVAFVVGVAEEAVRSRYHSQWINAGVADTPEIGIALDSTTTPATSAAYATTASFTNSGGADYVGIPAAGYHFLQSLEKGGGSGDTFRGDNGGTVPLSYQAGMLTA